MSHRRLYIRGIQNFPHPLIDIRARITQYARDKQIIHNLYFLWDLVLNGYFSMKFKKFLIDFVHINKIIVSSDFFALQKNFFKKLFHFFKKQVFKVLKNLCLYQNICFANNLLFCVRVQNQGIWSTIMKSLIYQLNWCFTVNAL